MKSNDGIWASKFGDEYTERNRQDLLRLEKQTVHWDGMTRSDLNRMLLGHVNRSVKILEVGCNIGLQMVLLQRIGFRKVWGIDVNKRAIQSAAIPKQVRVGSGQNIPFKANTFDVVMTSGVLIHLPEPTLQKTISEMYRVSKGLIYCREHYSPARKSVEYFGRCDLLWHDDFAQRFMDQFPDLLLDKQWRFRHDKGAAIDDVFLLRKKTYSTPKHVPPKPKKPKRKSPAKK